MSRSLLKRGLDLLEEDNKFGNKNKPSKNKKKGFKNIDTTLTKSKVRCALDAYERKHLKNETTSNLKLLKKIDQQLGLDSHASKVKELHLKKLEKNQPIKETKKEVEKSAFSEEDFGRIADIVAAME